MTVRLVERARDGDEAAFTELVDLHGDRCYAIAYRILRDTERAQDAVQQAFLLCWRELPKLRDPERFGVWLHRLLVNACYEEYRRYQRWSGRVRALPVDGPAGPGFDRVGRRPRPARPGIRPADARAPGGLRAASPRRDALAAIAEIVGVPLGTVKSRLFHATRSLRTAIGADRDNDIPEVRPA